MMPLGLLGSSHVTTTELFVIECVETFSGALGTYEEMIKNCKEFNYQYLLHLS